MKLEHFFLRSASAPVPERWRQAFPAGQALDAPDLLAHLRVAPTTDCLAWLCTADAQWALYLHQILQSQSGARVVLLSNTPEPQEGLAALNAGVRGYTHAYAVPALLQEVATVVTHGGLWVGPDLLQRLIGSTHTALAGRTPPPASPAGAARPVVNPWAVLSAREAQVARAVTAGRSNREVAALLFISERTVKAHLGTVFEKLGVRDRLQLVLRLAAFVESAPTPIAGPKT